MSDLRNAPIQIGQMNLKIPSASAGTGHRVSNGIGRHLAKKISPRRHSHLGALNLRVRVPAGATNGEMSDAVAEAIVRALRK
jgi:hypothetical protein